MHTIVTDNLNISDILITGVPSDFFCEIKGTSRPNMVFLSSASKKTLHISMQAKCGTSFLARTREVLF